MQLTVVIGATVTVTVDGHSAIDGAPFPDGSTVALTSSDPSIATVPDALPPTSGGESSVAVPATVLASGSTDITATVTTPDGKVLTDTSSLIVTPAVEGLTHITVTLTSP